MSKPQPLLTDFLELETSARPETFIPIYEPTLGEAEEAMVLDAVRSGWISSNGKYIREFEERFAAFCGAAHGISTSNGTTALHLAIHALGIGPGDEVIVPALTFVASANAVHYTGATPVFADVDSCTWTIDPAAVEALISPRTKAIMPVHLYGHPAPMGALKSLAEQHGLLLIEDAAEAHGAQVGERRTGNLGHVAAFSFFANKIITTGEGGMVTTNDAALGARCRLLRDHAMPPAPKGHPRYWHDEVGFNYRMTNLQAAVGVAQMARIDEFIMRKRAIAHRYQAALCSIPGLTLPVESPGYTNVYWMYSLLVNEEYPLTRDALILALRERNIDSRPFFHPLDTLPPYRRGVPCPTALRLSRQGINLPSAPSLTDEQIDSICDTLCALSRS
ncbi:MAG: DegT/DnrJ/EryC1/StrS family aminotransferase [Caldilineaceae bacterium]